MCMAGKRVLRSSLRWRRAAIIAMLCLVTGCAGVAPFGGKSSALRKQVEADSFPSAQQAGL